MWLTRQINKSPRHKIFTSMPTIPDPSRAVMAAAAQHKIDEGSPRMKKYLTIATAVAAVSLAGAGTATAAYADAHPTVSPQAEQTIQQAAKCKMFTGTARENLVLRKKPKTSASGLRLVYKGTKACWLHAEVNGGKYTKCHKTSDVWDYVSYRGSKGWVPHTCMKY